jgi:glycosyltransferase involved in cell wall biosynthesis
VKQVSVVIPTYNRAELLKLTIQSILAQTLRPLEIIIVDDGSTDHTAEVCASFAPAVRYMGQVNGGVSAARNAGIRAAKGEWIAFCDSDDLWMYNKLELQLAAIDATGAGWSVTGFALIDPEGRGVAGGEHGFRLAFPVFSETRITPQQHLTRWLEERELRIGPESMHVYTGDAFGMLFLGNVVMPSTAIVAREVIDRAGFFDESFHVAEDTEFFHRVAAQSRLTIVMKPLADHRIGHPSLVAEKSDLLVQNAITSVERAASLRPELTAREREAFRDGLRMLRLRLAYARLAGLDPRGARKALGVGSNDYIVSRRSIAILFASLLPPNALRGLHRAKRLVSSLRS